MTSRILGATALVAILAAASAQAADLPRREAPPAMPDVRMPAPLPAPASWAGFYAGGTGGYGLGLKGDVVRDRTTEGWFDTTPDGTGDQEWDRRTTRETVGAPEPAGAVAGGFVGYNFQSGNIVFGVEADANWSGMRKRTTTSDSIGGRFSNPDLPGEFVEATTTDTVRSALGPNMFGSLRGRLGYSFGDMMVYGTAGIGMVDVDQSVEVTRTRIGASHLGPIDERESMMLGRNKEWKTSLVAGAGLDWRLTGSLFLRAEYQYHLMDKTSASGVMPAFEGREDAYSVRMNPSFQTIRLGIGVAF